MKAAFVIWTKYVAILYVGLSMLVWEKKYYHHILIHYFYSILFINQLYKLLQYYPYKNTL